MTLATYSAVQERLQEIDQSIADRQENYENAAREYFQAKRDHEKDWATAYLKSEGTVEERRQRAVLEVWKSDSYKRLVAAEANYEALKGVLRTFETRASIGQSLLKAMQREVGG